MFDRVTFDPMLMGGRACIRGMRITVALIVNLVANGMSREDIIREYPELEGEDIRQSLQYASALATKRSVFLRAPRREISSRHGRVAHDRGSTARGSS